MSTYEEWRVTGTTPKGRPYDTPYDTEDGARALIAIARMVGWLDGPHLHKRIVTIGEWTEVDA